MATTSVNFTTAVAQPVATPKTKTPRNFSENINIATNALTRAWEQIEDMPALRDRLARGYAELLAMNNLLIKAERDRNHAS